MDLGESESFSWFVVLNTHDRKANPNGKSTDFDSVSRSEHTCAAK